MLRIVNSVCSLMAQTHRKSGRRPIEAGASIRIFSEVGLIFATLAGPSGTLETRRRLAIGLFERGAEVAITGEAEVERQTS